MATVLFPTSPGRIPTGKPLEARCCKCGDQRMFDGENCCRCGFYPLAVIRATWAAAAQRMASKSKAQQSTSRLTRVAT